jgi:enolase
MGRQASGGWTVAVRPAGADDVEELAADAVILAVPAPAAARLLAEVDRSLAAELAGIDYAGSAVVSLGFSRAGIAHPLDAAGMVKFYSDLCARYPIVSIEDGMAEDDLDGWKALTQDIRQGRQQIELPHEAGTS